jgi:hypothetical protein
LRIRDDFMVEGDGFEPSKSIDNRFTVCPLWPLGNPSIVFCLTGTLSQNPTKAAREFQSTALPIKLPGKNVEIRTYFMLRSIQSIGLKRCFVSSDFCFLPFWWAFRDSNPGPTGYEPVALTN